ncbi:unnamed protein product, partial [marine sediment metagenome]
EGKRRFNVQTRMKQREATAARRGEAGVRKKEKAAARMQNVLGAANILGNAAREDPQFRTQMQTMFPRRK